MSGASGASALLLLAWIGGLGVQLPPEQARGVALAGGPQAALESAAARFARVWSEGDPAAIGGFMAPGGAKLHLVDTSHGALGSRKMIAALGSFLQEHQTREIEVVRVSDVGGSPPRGFAEIGWSAVRGGTVEEVSYTVYVGFVLQDGDWRVTEVRVMR